MWRSPCWALFVGLGFFAACVGWGDAFDRPRRITPQYGLLQAEEHQTYFLDGPGKPAADGLGLVDGWVDSLGWNDTLLIVHRHARRPGQQDGWMFVNVRSGLITGPHDGSVRLQAARATGIHIVSADTAYASLR